MFTSPRKTAFFIFYISHINTRLDLDIFLSFGANDFLGGNNLSLRFIHVSIDGIDSIVGQYK